MSAIAPAGYFRPAQKRRTGRNGRAAANRTDLKAAVRGVDSARKDPALEKARIAVIHAVDPHLTPAGKKRMRQEIKEVIATGRRNEILVVLEAWLYSAVFLNDPEATASLNASAQVRAMAEKGWSVDEVKASLSL